MYTKLQKLQLTVKLHTPNYTILLYIMPNYISYLKLGHYTITPKFSNYANHNNLHQLHQTTPTHLTTVTKPNNLKLQQCTPTAPNYTTLYELHQTRKEPQQTTPITRTTSATPVYINYTYYTVE